MKVIKLFLKILMSILFILISMSFVLENVAIKTITKDVISKKISGYFLDNIIYDFDIDTIEEIEDKVRFSKYTENITSKYIDILVSNLAYNQNNQFDITNDITQIVEKELKDILSQEQKNKIYEFVQKQSSSLESRIENDIPTGFNTYDIVLFMKIYGIFTNIIFRVVMIGLLFIDIIVLTLLEKKHIFKDIQVGILSTVIFSLIVFILIKIFSRIIEQNFTGGWIDNINLNMLVFFIIVEVILSLILYFIRIRVNDYIDEK